jgi:phosphoenolpyruvate carboxykinase (GTP)
MKDQEVIFSNGLKGPDGKPYWLGMGVDAPKEGRNHFGPWTEGVKDKNGNTVGVAHANARYTMRLDYLDNIDKKGFEAKDGVPVEGILYGGRDSDTTVPIEESPSWKDGILMKAATLESETTSATLGAEGVRKPSAMANMDFLSYPLGEYTLNNIKFGEGVKKTPKIFSTNYFMLDENGHYTTSKLAKKVWLHWADGRINGEFDAYDTPTGKIPKYEDLAAMFKKYLDEDFSKDMYTKLFTFRCTKWINKLERAKAYYKKMDPGTPDEIFQRRQGQIRRPDFAGQLQGLSCSAERITN